MPPKTIVVVTPTRNEATGSVLVLAELALAAERLSADGWSLSLLVVDDQSTDGTVEVIERESKLRGIPSTIVDGPGLGISRALLLGLSEALKSEPTLLATLDFDGQHDASQLPQLVDRWVTPGSVDTVFGTRFGPGAAVTGIHGIRKLISHAAQRCIGVTTVGPAVPSDSTTSFRLFTPRVAQQFIGEVAGESLDGYRFFSWFAVFISCRFSFAEVPIDFRPRLAGESKLRLPHLVSFVLGLRALRSASRRWVRNDR
jgi:dolichol-phosphate mannosyltransferase